ncbi:hypothetical protein ZIOFF_030828 [Zingiber officinale]|uniref:Uncharacterized protein n=1 Tax=Zingiber officinale TaxID=94328 RepID=A0A8J5LC15_ZINOF|nr:hypothetical protein ZIOFF_030828 [Zingiber officinale]
MRVPKDRILIETDAPDGLLRLKTNHLFSIPDVPITELEEQSGGSVRQPASLSKEGLNHPANIHSDHKLAYDIDGVQAASSVM